MQMGFHHLLFVLVSFAILSQAQRDPAYLVNVTQVDSPTPGGVTYGVNSVIEVEVEFSHPVQITSADNLRLKLNIWRDTVKAYASADYVLPTSAPNKLRFLYIVRRRDFTPDYLDFLKFDSLQGGVIEPHTSLCSSRGALLDCPALSTFMPPKGTTSLFKRQILVWGFPPVVVDATSTSPTGVYGTGSVFNITLEFTVPVQVVRQRHTQNLPLNTDISNGAPPAFASYVGGSGTKFLSFTYTLLSGQFSPSLNWPEGAALQGLVIQDANNEADYNLPSPSLNTLNNVTIVADGVPAYPVMVTSTASAGSLFLLGQTLPVIVLFSKPINVVNYKLVTLITNVGIFNATGFVDNKLLFNIRVPEGVDTNEFNYLGESSLIVGGGKIFDYGRNVANFLLPPLNSEINIPGSNTYSPLGKLKLRIRTVPPTFLSATASTSGAFPPGFQFSISLIVSHPLTLTNVSNSNPYLTLNDGGIANFSAYTNIGVPILVFVYTIPSATTFFDTPIDIRGFHFDSTHAALINEANLPFAANSPFFNGPNLSKNNRITFIPAIAVPAAPVGLVATNRTSTSVTISWQKPADNGSPIYRFQVDRGISTDSFVMDTQIEVLPADNSTVFTYVSDKLLLPGQTYYFRVAAQNSIGLGPYTSPISVTTLL